MKLYVLAALLLLSCTATDKKVNYLRFNHVMLYVADLDTSIDFYSRAFPLEIRARIDTLQFISGNETSNTEVTMATLGFAGQDFVLEISEQQNLPDSVTGQAHYQHLGINVLNIETAYARLVDAGAGEVSPIREIRANEIVVKNAFLRGPDGELIELMEVLEGYF